MFFELFRGFPSGSTNVAIASAFVGPLGKSLDGFSGGGLGLKSVTKKRDEIYVPT